MALSVTFFLALFIQACSGAPDVTEALLLIIPEAQQLGLTDLARLARMVLTVGMLPVMTTFLKFCEWRIDRAQPSLLLLPLLRAAQMRRGVAESHPDPTECWLLHFTVFHVSAFLETVIGYSTFTPDTAPAHWHTAIRARRARHNP